MSEMVERVARAVCSYQERPCPISACCPCIRKARAAIEEMRHLTDEMIWCFHPANSDVNCSGSPEDQTKIRWSAAINEALK